MCPKFQVSTNAARMQTQQCIFIFSNKKYSIKQVADNDNYMAYEDLTSVSEVRHASNPVILIFQI